MISSGDSGSGYTEKATGRGYDLYASWPASSPWVTAVGATRFDGHTIGSEEMASDQVECHVTKHPTLLSALASPPDYLSR